MKRHTYLFVPPLEVDDTVRKLGQDGYRLDEQFATTPGPVVSVMRFKKQGRGPLGRFRRTRWLHLLVVHRRAS